jgi:hypothetical protein
MYATIKRSLAPKDGFVHVVLINSYSTLSNKMISFDEEYTEQINLIMTAMQKDGYEIVDVKFNAGINDRVLFSESNVERFNTLIMYK